MNEFKKLLQQFKDECVRYGMSKDGSNLEERYYKKMRKLEIELIAKYGVEKK